MKEILIKNVTILTMDDENSRFFGWILLKNGKIDALGEGEPPACSEVLDGEGGVLTPGLIDIHSHLGLYEDGLGFEGADGNEDTDPVTPQMRAIDAVNPMDHAFREALEAGVTAAGVSPGSSNAIGGQIALIKTAGRRIDDMIVKAPLAMKFALGENPKSVYHDKDETPVTRMATAALIRDELYKGREYLSRKARAEVDDDHEEPDYDGKMEALLPVLNGSIEAHFHAHRADDILTALRIAREFDLDITLDHCTEGHLIVDQLVKAGKPVLVGPSFGSKSKIELREKTFETAGILDRAGLEVCIITDAPVIPLYYLPLCAGLAVKAGMKEESAWRAITINPAHVVGIADRVGSLEVGKDADIAIFEGNPLRDIQCCTKAVFVGGKQVVGE